jgi:hypothetical protein
MKSGKISTALRAHSLLLPLVNLMAKTQEEGVHLKDLNLKREQDRAMKGLFKRKLNRYEVSYDASVGGFKGLPEDLEN